MKKLLRNPVARLLGHDAGHGNDRNQNVAAPVSNSGSTGFIHYPNIPSSNYDSYSHTADSTAGYSQSRTYPALNNVCREPDRSTIKEQIESSATNLLSNLVGADTAATVANKLNNVVVPGGAPREILRHGTMIQLQSRISGALLQIVISPEGTLTFDGNGVADAFNSFFMVEEGERGKFRFHNNCNYLASDGKHPCIISLPPGPKNNPQIDFRVHDVAGSPEFIALESCVGHSFFISITDNGQLKQSHAKLKNEETHFRIIPVPLFNYGQYPSNQYRQPSTAFPAPTAPPAPTFQVPSNNNNNPYVFPPASSQTTSSLYPTIH